MKIEASPVPASPRNSGRLALLLIALVSLSGVAAFRLTAPSRAESELQRASLNDLVKLAKKDKDNPRLFYYQGKRLVELNSLGPAYAAFARACYLDEDKEDYWLEWAEVASRFHDANESVSICMTYLKNHPKSANGHLALAKLYQQKKVHFRGYDEAKLAVQFAPNNSEAWRTLGMEALTIEKSQEAEEAFRKSAAIDPKDWRNQTALGNILADGKRYQEAAKCFSEAVRLAPNEFVPYLALGDAQASQAKTPAQLTEAKATLRHALKLQPDSASAWLMLGQVLYAESNWLDARETLKKAAELNPNDPEVHLTLSQVYRKLNDLPSSYKEAKSHQVLREYETEKLALGSRTRATNDPLSRLALARLFAKHGDISEAIDTYQNILSRAPQDQVAKKEHDALLKLPKSSMNRLVEFSGSDTSGGKSAVQLLHDADELMKRAGYKSAEDAYRAILRRYPKSAEAYEGIGLALESQNNQEEAFRYLQKSVKLNPKLEKSSYAIARLYYSLGFQDEAGRRMTALAKEYPQNAVYWFGLGMCYGDSQLRYAEALSGFEHAVALKPEDFKFRQTLADMQVKMHRIKEGGDNYRKVIAVAPKDPNALFGLGKFLAEHGTTLKEEEEAYRILTEVDLAAPGFPQNLFQLGRIDLKRGNLKLALERLEKAAANTEDVSTLFTLAKAYQQNHEGEKATLATARATKIRNYQADLTHSEELARQSLKDMKLRLRLARLYAQGGKDAKAINQYEVAISLAPEDPALRKELQSYIAQLKRNGRMPEMKLFNGLMTAVVPTQK